jgi:S-DNA-T family DNA segregation ATPase FtsK/SpoIIIE
MATSLVLTHRPYALRLLAIDPKGRTFRALADVPHLTRPCISDPAEALEALHSLLRTMEIRDRRGELPGDARGGSPGGVARIVVFIDELADLMMAGGKAVTEALTRLAQRGREAGIHLVAATQHPSAAILGSVMRANFPLRLVGRVVSGQDARVAAGRGGTDAHLLHGRGDFLAVSGGAHPLRFQVANIEEDEIREVVSGLTRQRRMLPGPGVKRET